MARGWQIRRSLVWRFALCLLLASATARAAPPPELYVEDIDFGEIALDTTAIRYATLANAGGGQLAVTSATISDPHFSFAAGACAGAQTCTFDPPIAITSVAALVAIQCDATAAGVTITGTLAFTSNSADQAHSTVQLACGTLGGQVAFAPPQLAFGAVSIHATPPLRDLELENQTSEPLVLDSLAITGSGSARFTTPVRAGSAVVVPGGGGLAIPITYTPSGENRFDAAELTVGVSGASGPLALSAELSGSGVDCHALVISLPAFPDTLLGPEYAASVEPIVIGNGGGAVLQLGTPTITGAPVWSFVNPGPVDVPANTAYPLLVRFQPDAVGPAPVATFSIATNDVQNPILSGSFGGSGSDRQFTMTPALVDLHFAGVGDVVHASDPSRDDEIVVTNTDASHTYTIAGIHVFGGDGAFEVLGASGALPPGTSRRFDVAFTPAHAGDYTATAALFLDLDPNPEASVELRGSGVFVEAGGVGCAAGGGGVGGAVIVVIALAAASLGRRRRRALAVVFAGSAAMFASTAAHAQARDLDLAVFDPSPSTGAPTFAIPTAVIGTDGAWVVGATLAAASNLLVLTAPTNENTMVRDRETLAIGGAFAIAGMFEVGVHVPFYVQSGEDLSSATMYGEPAVASTAIGNLELDAKGLATRYDGMYGAAATGLVLGLQLPTATSEAFAGSPKPQLRVLAVAHYEPPLAQRRIALDAGFGGVIRGHVRYDDIDQKSGIDWTFGASLRVVHSLAVSLELFGEVVPGGIVTETGGTRALDTAEFLAGAHYQIDRHTNVGVAVGRGLTGAIGSPGITGMFEVTVAPLVRRPTSRDMTSP